MIPIPLEVRIATSRGSRNVTRELRDLAYRSVAPGGYASLQMSIDRTLALQPDELDYYGTVYVYDGQTGRTLWEGRLEDPGRSASADGETWDVTAIGPMGHVRDRTVPYVVVHNRIDGWHVGPASASVQYVNVDLRDDEGVPVIRMHAPNGVTFVNGHAALAGYADLWYTGQELARVNLTWTSGFTGNNEARLGSGLNNGVTVAVETDTISSGSGTLTGSRGGSNDITSGHNTVRVRFARISSSLAVSNDDHWIEFRNPVVRALLKDAAGNDITSGYDADTVLASDVVADLLGRVLDQYDGAGASITATTHQIDHLSYPDGVSPEQVLNDLMKLEPAYYWAAWETTSAGTHRFEWRTWPTTVRYEADISDGYDAPGSADGLYNAVRIRYREAAGRIRTVQRTQAVAVLDDAGLTREGFIDLGDEIGSSTNANRVGDEWLADHAHAPNAGRLRVARRILDRDTGRMVAPWEILPGHLIRVRGVLPRVDSLNASDRDGISVFRIVSSEYRVSDGAAMLELDSYAPSVARALADVATRPVYRRR